MAGLAGDGSVAAASEGRLEAADGGDDGSRAPRLPRWTRQEILVLIQGKRVAESRVRRRSTAAMGPGQAEPKWASVASYCKIHGVNRGPVQCRKRWSNLAGDYKKIKEWESRIRESESESESESFWVMRNDLRRDKKLPGFFDKEVYDILDGAPVLSVAAPPPGKEEAVESAAAFDSGRSAAVEEGLFSDHEDGDGSPEKDIPVAIPASIPISGASREKQPETGSTSQDGRKRKRTASDEDEEPSGLEARMIDIMARNGKMLSAQLETRNGNVELEREQRREHADGLVAALNRLADALGRIADRL